MISLSFLSARFADKSHVGSCEGRRPFFADNFSEAEIISKKWASKNCSGQFFRCVIRADFFETTKVGRKSSEFFEP